MIHHPSTANPPIRSIPFHEECGKGSLRFNANGRENRARNSRTYKLNKYNKHRERNRPACTRIKRTKRRAVVCRLVGLFLPAICPEPEWMRLKRKRTRFSFYLAILYITLLFSFCFTWFLSSLAGSLFH
ncbi:hypothetical protein KQX54_018818 [Cotesia glomerata]|uniref:Transmembrane protein n=1 Tax=Cotesia glomerata TaxID=32391 RepID=A0AAV7I3L8_COTGL|nr:hypothetical protein KQX54_018818 [Cotesia glomerata]